MQTSNNFLLIDDQSLVVDNKVRRGTIHRCDLTIRNIGNLDEATINFWLETNDLQSETLLNWYTFSPNPPLKVKRGEQYRVTLNFEIPQQAIPNLYNYSIVFESVQYPGLETRRPFQLQVNPSEQDLELDMDPRFTLEPITTSANPQAVGPEDTLKVSVIVENRSKLVDRYYLTCPDLSPSWFTVQYPESPIETQGLIQETDGLPLNPRTKGEITLLLHPPKYTPAGDYCPTLQLTSRNQEDLVLLDIVYLKILPDSRLEMQLMPSVRRIPEESGSFDVFLINSGNLRHHLSVQASDRNALFTYIPDLENIDLPPGNQTQIHLVAKPRKWWRRPWRGKGVEFLFDLDLLTQQTSTATSRLAGYEAVIPSALPTSSTQGTIIWQPRPWWLLWLLIGLPLLSLIGIAVTLWLNRPRPPVPPEILAFQATKVREGYQEGKGQPIRLDWEVTQLDQIDRITITRLERGVETHRKNYYFNLIDDPQQPIPKHLQPTTEQKNNFCVEKPPSLELTASKPRSATFFFSWFNLSNRPQIEQPAPMLVCEGIYTTTQKAGEYTFQMQVFRRQPKDKTQEQEPVATRITDTIPVKPSDDPQIVSFAPTQLLYREPNPSPTAALTQGQLDGVVRLNWRIINPSRIEELRLISLAPDGSTQGEAKQYSLSQGLPLELQRFCVLRGELTCRNVPTDARRPGNYVYKLTAIAQKDQGTSEVTKNTEPIKIQPKEIRILSFKVNGREASQKPKHVYLLGEQGESVEIVVSWQVDGGEDLQVELIPSPGAVSRQGAIGYPINPPSTETITLKVSNGFGNQKSQSVIIQTIEAKPPDFLEEPVEPPPIENPSSGRLPVPLPPIEVAPEAN